MSAGDPLAALTSRIIKSKPRNSRRSFFRNDLQTLNNSWNHHVFESGIQTFGVLADDHEVEFRIAAGNVWQRANRTQVGIQVERFSEAYVDGGEAFADRSGDRPLERDLVFQDRVKQSLRQRFAKFLQSLRAGVMSFPLDFYTRSFDDAHYVSGDFGADAVAGNQCDTMVHKQIGL